MRVILLLALILSITWAQSTSATGDNAADNKAADAPELDLFDDQPQQDDEGENDDDDEQEDDEIQKVLEELDDQDEQDLPQTPVSNYQNRRPTRKSSWPELRGENVLIARREIRRDPRRLTVVLVPQGSFVTADYRTDRVRIYYSKKTYKVIKTPKIG